MPATTRQRRKPKTLAEVVRVSTQRALKRMQDAAARPQHTFRAGEINGWTADALASWVEPIVRRAVARWIKNRGRK